MLQLPDVDTHLIIVSAKLESFIQYDCTLGDTEEKSAAEKTLLLPYSTFKRHSRV
jgi:hypothetical protein